MAYDPLAPSTLADPADAHRWLRERCPVHRFDGFDPPFFTLSRHEDVVAALRDTATFSSEQGQGPRRRRSGGLFSDPPHHTAFRRLVQRAFTPRAVARLEPFVAALADELVDAIAPAGRGDLHEAVAFPLPTITIARMLGIPGDDRHHFKRWSDAAVSEMGLERAGRHAAELEEMAAYLLDQVADRRARLAQGEEPDDLIADLVRVEEGGTSFTSEEIMGLIVQLLVGGNETTTSLITNALVRLVERPDLLAAVAADLDLVDAVIEESLRFDAPVLGLFRTTTHDVTIDDATIPTDAKVMLLYAAANRDGAAFDGADDFRLDRPADEVRRHVAFGAGVHFCLGAPLARLEARHALRAVIGRLPNLRADGESERIEPWFLWGRRTLPLAWDA